MEDLKAYTCELIGQEHLGKSYVLAATRDKAKYATALSAHDAGYLCRASPASVRCKRAPDYDARLRTAKAYFPYSDDYVNTTLASRSN